MNILVISHLGGVALQGACYYACFSWLAWTRQRESGSDAFHLVIPYAAGSWVASTLGVGSGLGSIAVVLAGCMVGYLTDVLWCRQTARGHSNVGRDQALVRVITAAAVALILFDWATSHSPITLKLRGPLVLYPAAITAVVIGGAAIMLERSRVGVMLRLGMANRWAMEYWCQPLPKTNAPVQVLRALCWIPVLVIPLGSTGILSSTILKDVSLCIAIARIASSRGAVVLIATAATLATLRVAAGYLFVSSASGLAVEGAFFLCLLIWLRYRGRRTLWE